MLSRLSTLGLGLTCLFFASFSGCHGGPPPSFPLDSELAYASVEKAMKAWVDGKKPEDLKPAIIVGDVDWLGGKKLVSFEILTQNETSDGSNLHIPVKRKLSVKGKTSESTVAYVVGTSPVVTIFPQE